MSKLIESKKHFLARQTEANLVNQDRLREARRLEDLVNFQITTADRVGPAHKSRDPLLLRKQVPHVAERGFLMQ